MPQPGMPMPAAPPLQQASAQMFSTLDDVDAAYEAALPLYRRYGSPNQASLEQAMVELETDGDGFRGLATPSGMAAIHLACVAVATADRRVVVAPADVYGGTHHLLRRDLPALGIETRIVDQRDPAALERAMDGAALVVVETICNPAMAVCDIDAVAAAAHERGAVLMVDNTFASPILCRPIEHGADIVMHSTTKYVSGHGDALGGVLVYPSRFEERLRQLAMSIGSSPGPLDCWLALRGMRTLALRVEAVCAGAATVAERLAAHPAVSRVWYPGLLDHPSHEVAMRMLSGGFGGMLSFELAGGAAAVARFCRRLRLVPIMPSLADVATTISYPVATSHRGLDAAELEAAGVTPGMVRLSMGIEDPEDIMEDIEQALEA
jgi:cystathionine beta-lyase/cystathionine gamma-synthase